MEKLVLSSNGATIETDFHVIEGVAAKDIIQFSNMHDTDLIVLPTHGLTGIKHLLLGSVAEKVTRMAMCPVFTVKVFGKSLVDVGEEAMVGD